MKKTGYITVAAATVAALFSYSSLRFFDVPYAWLFLAWATVCLLASFRSRSSGAKVIAINLGAALAALAVAELYFYRAHTSDRVVRIESRLANGDEISISPPHSFLGWAPRPGSTVRFRRYVDDQLAFEMLFNIQENGLRISNVEQAAGRAECVLFFGGSFTFGEGVDDHESMPYVVSEINQARLRTHNFGYSGHGAHQMLSALDHGIVDEIVDCTPRYAIYQGIVDHVRRAANKAVWKPDMGPIYTLTEDDELIYGGQYDVRRESRSEILRGLVDLRVTSYDIDRYIAIVDASRGRIESRFPGTQFHVLFWDDSEDSDAAKIVDGLRQKGITVHLISEILPGFREDGLKYRVGRLDDHPSPLAHRLIAEYVNKTIIGASAE